MSGFLGAMPFGTQKVLVIHCEGTPQEMQFETEAHIQSKAGFFEVETPIYENDVVVLDDPRGGKDRRLAKEVLVHSSVPAYAARMKHIEVKWGPAPLPPRPVATVRDLA
jgi:hypothetical protein